jgi:hypothetical protein
VSNWFYIKVERALAVDRGVNIIVCTRHNGYGEEIVVRMSDEEVEKLKQQFAVTQSNGDGNTP